MSMLGSMILDSKQTVPIVASTLTGPDDLFSEAHRTIYDSILRLYAVAPDVDLVQIHEDLRDRGTLESVGGAAALQSLAYAVPSSANAIHYARIVRDKARRRRLAEAGRALVYDAYHDTLDTEALAERALSEVEKAGRIEKAAGDIKLVDAEQRLIDSMERREPSMAYTGVDVIDKLGGFPVNGVVTVIGYPSSGKTTLILDAALGLCQVSGFAVTVFSYEQSPERIAATLLSRESGVQMHELANRGEYPQREEWESIREAMAKHKGLDFRIVPDNLSADRIVHRCRTMPKGRRAIVVDYLQRLPPPPGCEPSHEASCRAESMRILTRISLDMGFLLIIVSQPSKEASKVNKRPTAADAKGAQEIEAFSDYVLCLWREHQHEPKPDSKDAQGRPFFDHDWHDRVHTAEIYWDKAKYGSLGSFKAMFHPQSMQFKVIE